MDGIHNELLMRTKKLELLYVVEKEKDVIKKKMDELACFLPGVLALGSYTSPNIKNSIRDLKTAKSLMYTCYQFFNHTATGLAPEIVKFNDENDIFATKGDDHYNLRPETVESLFYLNYLTGDPIYR